MLTNRHITKLQVGEKLIRFRGCETKLEVVTVQLIPGDALVFRQVQLGDAYGSQVLEVSTDGGFVAQDDLYDLETGAELVKRTRAWLARRSEEAAGFEVSLKAAVREKKAAAKAGSTT